MSEEDEGGRRPDMHLDDVDIVDISDDFPDCDNNNNPTWEVI